MKVGCRMSDIPSDLPTKLRISSSWMFNAKVVRESDRFTRYELLDEDHAVLSYTKVLDLWVRSPDFRSYFTDLLAHNPCAAFRWETPPITTSTINRGFEFVVVDTPEFVTRPTDAYTFEEYFADDTGHGVVTFKNIGGDASLVVPSPRTAIDAYGHLGSFVRNAPDNQIEAFWQVVGTTVINSISDTPVWLSSAGGGVAWLHMRLDSAPKYYSYLPYKTG